MQAMAVALLGMALAAPVGGDPVMPVWADPVKIETPRELARRIAVLPPDVREIVRAIAVLPPDAFVPAAIALNNSGLMQSCIDQSPEPAFAETWCREAYNNWMLMQSCIDPSPEPAAFAERGCRVAINNWMSREARRPVPVERPATCGTGPVTRTGG